MINKLIKNDIEYQLTSRNMKALFTGKTEHLRHFDPKIVKLEMSQGLNDYVQEDESIRLPNPQILQMTLDDAMEKRCSRRDFQCHNITLQELSTLLFYAAGYKRTEHNGRKHVPSSGGFSTTELFFVVLHSEEVPLGLYYFSAKDFSISCLQKGDFAEWVRNDALYQEEWCKASIIVFLASDYTRLYQKYNHRTLRLCLLDAGHMAQNLYLTCAAMDMKVCEVLGYVENEAEEAFRLTGNTPTYASIVIGR
jgi:SagB-type dehydrogenase family enzyme